MFWKYRREGVKVKFVTKAFRFKNHDYRATISLGFEN